MHTKLHTMWIVGISLMALLLSSVVSSSPLMTLNMLQQPNLSSEWMPTQSTTQNTPDCHNSAHSESHKTGHYDNQFSDLTSSSSAMTHGAPSDIDLDMESDLHMNASMDMDCGSEMSGVDTCCSMVCTASGVFFPTLSSELNRVANRLLIATDSVSFSTSHPRSLYRPPIV